MAHNKAALKRIQITERNRQRNRVYRTRLKSATRNVVEAETKEDAVAALKVAQSVIDKLAIKGIIPKNRAANQNSRLANFVAKMN